MYIYKVPLAFSPSNYIVFGSSTSLGISYMNTTRDTSLESEGAAAAADFNLKNTHKVTSLTPAPAQEARQWMHTFYLDTTMQSRAIKGYCIDAAKNFQIIDEELSKFEVNI